MRAAAGRRPARDVEVVAWRECATAERGHRGARRRRLRRRRPRRRGGPAGGLGLCRQLKNEIYQLPADPGAHRAPAGRLAGRLVARRRRRAAPPRPDRRRRGDRGPRAHARRGALTWRPRRPRPAPTWPDLLDALLARARTSSPTRPRWAMDQIMGGEASAGAGGRLPRGAARQGRVRRPSCAASPTSCSSTPTGSRCRARRIDIVGTGGDRLAHVNISTMAALVIAATGLRVVKHGNRAASSTLRLGRRPRGPRASTSTLAPTQVAEVAPTAGITFCFAQAFHPSMRHAGPARAGLGVGTAFNFLGPLTNPAQPTYAAVGVADARIAPLIAGVFADRGRVGAVFRGDDGLDELTIAGSSTVWWVRDGAVTEFSVDPDGRRPRASPGREPAGRRRRRQRRGGPRACSPASRPGARRGPAQRRAPRWPVGLGGADTSAAGDHSTRSVRGMERAAGGHRLR